tara:strand:- start:5342 stop:5473 length:132 start_codon:yes stop_codon:yes gene_type:complete
VVHTLIHTLVYIDDSEQYSKGMAQVVGKGAGLAKKRGLFTPSL